MCSILATDYPNFEVIFIDDSSTDGSFEYVKESWIRAYPIEAKSVKSSDGIVYLEAWFSGKPVIAARTDPMPEIITDGVDGYLVNFGDEKELTLKILKLLKDPYLCEEMGLNGKENVKVCEPRKICDKIEEIYHLAISSYRR